MMEVASGEDLIRKNGFDCICADINAMKDRDLSDRALSVLHMIESNIEDIREIENGLLKVLYGKDFGMIFNCICYDLKNNNWLVIRRNGQRGILFDSLVDTIWFVRSIYRPLEDGVFASPY